jgi:hypothetical protein
MALFDTGTNPFAGMNIFGARQPEYLGGLLTPDQQERLKNQSLLSGVLTGLATYAATPKNQGIGIPAIIGKSYLGAMQGAQNPYTQATENELTKLKIQKEQRDAELDRLKAIPSEIRQFEYGLENPAFFAREEKLRSLSRAQNIINNAPNKAILDIDKGTIEGLAASTNSARSIANQTRTINSLIGNQQGSGAIKLTSDLQNFLGISTPTANVNQAVQAIATKAATEIRTPGSGSTSDLEFGAYRSSFPSLATSKEGRDIMVKIAEANATRNAKLTDWARKQYQAGTFSYEGLAAYDNSLGQAVGNDIKKRVDELTGNVQAPGGGLSQEGQKVLDLYLKKPPMTP